MSDPRSAVVTFVCKRAVGFPSKATFWSRLASKRSSLGAVNSHPDGCVGSEGYSARAAGATKKADATKKEIVEGLKWVFMAYAPLAAGTTPRNAGYAAQPFIARHPRLRGCNWGQTSQPSAIGRGSPHGNCRAEGTFNGGGGATMVKVWHRWPPVQTIESGSVLK